MKLFYQQYKNSNNSDVKIVLLHGMLGMHSNLNSLAKHLANLFTVISLDLPNHGKSPHQEHTTLNSMAKDVINTLDELSTSENEKYILIGHSLGGKVAMELALKQPNIIQSLVVIDIAPVLYKPRNNDVLNAMQSVVFTPKITRADIDKQLVPLIKNSAVRAFIMKNLARDPQGEFFWLCNHKAIANNYHHYLAANSMGEYNKNCLFIKGQLSDYILDEYHKEIINRFPNYELVTIKNAGHWTHSEKPTECENIITEQLCSEND